MSSRWRFRVEVCDLGDQWRLLRRYVSWGSACRAFSIALAAGVWGVRILDREGRQIEAAWPRGLAA